MHFLHRVNDQGSKMRKIDDLTYRLKHAVPGLITLRRVEVHARPMAKTVGR